MKKREITLAIHPEAGTDFYSDKWIEYCQKYNINYKLVDCYGDNIIEELRNCDALLWHWIHIDYKAQLFARQLILSLEMINFPVYPNAKTCWHFDDKLGQKYLLEAIQAPTVKNYAFFDKKSAIEWINKTSFPKVFKLRNGAGAHNVQLIDSIPKAKKYINKMFSSGFRANYRGGVLSDKLWHFKRDKSLKSFLKIGAGVIRYIFPHKVYSLLPIEKNYLYAQDFIPNCDHDIRVFVIGNRAVTKKRMVRDGDFRASGSGKMSWDIEEEGKKCVDMAFKVAEKLQTQSLAFDFVKDSDGYKIVEISFAASPRGFPESPGYWTRDLEWIETSLRVEYFIIEDLINSLSKKS
jgi:glutathione synthase/RimK-type ligase-like ATP-grasp enzyme